MGINIDQAIEMLESLKSYIAGSGFINPLLYSMEADTSGRINIDLFHDALYERMFYVDGRIMNVPEFREYMNI